MPRVLLFCALVLTACARTEAPVEIWKDFSGENALRHVQALVDCGPRPPGTPEIECARTYIIAQLETFGWKVTKQEFTDETPRGPMRFINLIATFPGKGDSKAAPSFLLCSHYDTKFFETARFVGANDGGSSNGLLLEMARVLAQAPRMAAQVELVFFDGEEAYVNFTGTDGLYGSRYFARRLGFEDKAKQFRGGILFDMIGDKSLGITLSTDSPPGLTSDIFTAAEKLNARKYFTYAAGSILDDHTPLNQVGIPTIDLIDFDYPPWHTPDDTMDKISAESLRIIGSVAARYLAETALK
ncbi:MAG: M28 family peptidase [Chthoniobacterales bacterium]